MATLEKYEAEYGELESIERLVMPYAPDVDGNGVFVLKNYTLGVAWLLEPLPTSGLRGLDKAHIANQLAGALSRLEDGVRIQIITLVTRNIEDAQQNYLSHGGTDQPVLAMLERAKSDFFARGVHGLGTRSGDLENTIKSVRIMVTLIMPPPGTLGGAGAAVSDALSKGGPSAGKASSTGVNGRAAATATVNGAAGKGSAPAKAAAGEPDDAELEELPGVARFVKGYRHYKKLLGRQAQTIDSVLHACHAQFRRASRNEFARFYRSMVEMNAGANEQIVLFDHQPLSEQLVRQEVTCSPEGFITCDGYHHQVVTVDNYPNELYAGMLSEPHANLGLNSLLDYIIDGAVVMSISLPRREDVQSWNQVRLRNAKEGDGDPIERQVIVDECQLIRQWIMNEGRRMVDFQLSISMADRDRLAVRNRVELVHAKLLQMGFAARIEQKAAPTYWAHQLPFGWKPTMRSAGRVRRRVDLAVACLLPIYLMGRGTRAKVFLGLNQRNEPFGLDFFECPTAYNWACVGESGSGKSVTINNIIADYQRSGTDRHYIFDIGGSYRTLFAMIGAPDAQYIDLSKDEKIGCNCFDGTYEIASGYLLEFIPYLALREGEKLDPVVQGKMERVLQRTFDRKLRRNVPYKQVRELVERFPAMHIARLCKRVEVEPIAEDVMVSLKELRAAETVNKPRFDFFFKIRITGRVDKQGRRSRVNALEQLSELEFSMLRQTYPVVAEDEEGVYVLSGQPSQVDSLAFDGWECHLVKGSMILEAADRADYEAVARFGVTVIMSPAYIAEQRAVIEREVRQRYRSKGAGEAELEQHIRDEIEARVASISGGDYFDTVEGEADLQEQVFFREFAQELKDSKDDDMIDLANRLAPYYGTGAYRSFFDVPTGFKITEARMVCFDFTRLFNGGGDKKLIGALLGALLQMVTMHCISPRSIGYRKQVIIDELKQFQVIPCTDPFVDTTGRQGRKFGFCVGLGTQSINDLIKANCNLLEIMQFLIIGAQKSQVISSTKETLKFSAVQRARISSVATQKGVWAEFVVFCERLHIFEVMRVIMTPEMYWVATTDKPDKAIREKAIRKYNLEGYKPREAVARAIAECARELPHGKAFADKAALKR